MDFFKNIKKTVDSANEAAAAAQAMAAAHQQAATMPIDESDPMWEPIHGVGLDKYAEITSNLAKQNLAGQEAIGIWLRTQGADPEKWPEINVGWANRMAGSVAVRNRYGMLYRP